MRMRAITGRFAVVLLLWGLLPVFAAQTIADETKSLRAGVSIVDITPPLGETIVGSFAPFPATTVHDPLFARCLILDNGQTHLGFVVCDNLGISREVFESARELIAKETSLQPDHLLMAATHTHSATRSGSSKYSPQLARGIADAVCQAWSAMQPAKIGWGSVDEPSEVFNRRWFVSDQEMLKSPFGGVDKVRMNPPRGHAALVKPAGPTDPEISFISVQKQDGTQLALLANYSLHYVGGVEKGSISADYFGVFSREIAKLLVPESASTSFVGILTNGTSGDINNLNFYQQTPRLEPYQKMTQVGQLVAKRVAEAHSSIKFHDWIPLASTCCILTLDYRKPDAEMQAYFADVLKKPEDASKHHRYERTYAQRVQGLLDGPDSVDVPLQALQIGDLGVVGIPFEVFAEIGLEIKQKSPLPDTCVIELANDTRGYLPTPRQHELGGYETWMGTSKVQLDASDKITNRLLEMLGQLADAPSSKTQ